MHNDYFVKAKLYEHQKCAHDFALRLFGVSEVGVSVPISKGCFYLMDMGTGKTLTSIAVMGSLYRWGLINRVLVVAPLSILGVWAEEMDKFAAYDFNAAVLEGTMAKKVETLRRMVGEPLQMAIVGYESMWRMEEEIARWRPDFILCDESHRIKTHSAKAAKAAWRLGAKAKYRLALTGTPITNKPLDLFSQMRFLNDSIFGASFYSFRSRYFNMVGYGNHTPVLKKVMEPELIKKAHSIAFRATKAECLDLPPVIEITQHVQLEPAAAKLYRELVKDSYTQLGGKDLTAANVLTKLLRLSQATGGFLGADDDPKPRQISTAKLDALADIIEDAQESGQKLVIIARFIPEIAAIKALLEKRGIEYAAISGETKGRAEQVRRFQNEPNVTVFVGQIQTAGLGVTLTAASTLVFYSVDYNFANFEQSKARIHRVGQTEPCTYIYLTAKGTVDEKVLKALRGKADLAKTLIDDCRNGVNPFA